MEEKYKVGYYDSNDKRKYKIVSTKAEVLDLISDLMNFPGHISVKRITEFSLEDNDNNKL